MDTPNVNVAQLQSGIAAEIRDCLKNKTRPLPITIVAALAAVFAVLGAMGVLSMLGNGLIFSAILGILVTLVSAASAIGFWGMRRWAVKLYIGATAFAILQMLLAGALWIQTLVVPAIVLFFCKKHWNEMK